MMAACWVLLFNYLRLTYIRIQRDLQKTGLKRVEKAWKSVGVPVFAQIQALGGRTDPRASLPAAGMNPDGRIPKSPG